MKKRGAGGGKNEQMQAGGVGAWRNRRGVAARACTCAIGVRAARDGGGAARNRGASEVKEREA